MTRASPSGNGARRGADLVGLIARVYESALSPRPFQETLAPLAEALGGDAALIALWAPEIDAGAMGVSHGMPAVLVDGYRNGLWKTDAWRLAIERKNVPVGRAVAGRQLVPFTDLMRTGMYNDVLRPYGFFDTCCGRIYARETAGAAISLLRARGRPFFGRREVKELGAVLPHMTRAFALHRRLAELIAERTALADALDRRHGGALLCGRNGEIVYASEAARHMLAAGTPLFTARGRLRVRDPDADAALRAIFRDGGKALGERFAAHAVAVRSEDGGVLRLSVLRKVAGTILDAGATDIAFYVLIEGAAAPDSLETLARAFALTPAETRLARHLAAGATLAECAEALGVSVNTVRSQLQQIFQKTGVSRQAALVRLLLSARGTDVAGVLHPFE